VQVVRHACVHPARPAIVDGATDVRLTWGELAARSAALAGALAARGIGRGDLVAVAMPNGAGWAVAALGVWRAGAAVVPVNVRWAPDEAARLLGRVRPRLALAADPFADLVRAAGDALDVVVTGGDAAGSDDALGAGAGADPFAEPQVGAGDLAVVPFSSGTGGLAKGVRLTHGNLAAAVAGLAAILASAGRFDAESVSIAVVPFSHVMGLGPSLCAPLSVGGRIVTAAQPELEHALALIAEHRVTHATLPLPLVERLATDPRLERLDVSSLEFVGTAGAHLPAAVQRRASERLRCMVRQGYGLTEASPVAGPLGRPSDPETVGWLMPGIEARLVDPESGRDGEPGRSGELWLRGPQVTAGYHDDPDATTTTLAGGWLRTGDLVRVRDDGQLVIVDRLKELIKVDGASVAPAELELVLREHPAVRDAAVIGRPDARHGEVPIAFVVPAGRTTPAELIEFAAARLSAHKRLHAVEIVDELPRTPGGKLVRRVLTDRDGATARAPWTRAATVRWADVDANGHMRNTAYSDFASDARLAFFAEHGFPLERLHELGITPVILTEELTYRREATLGEELVVSVAVSSLNYDASRGSMEQRITKANGSTAAIVRLDGAWLALDTRTLVSPPAQLAEVMRSAPRARAWL
jgi:YbgC/YbaW family acyl-CoA thioester hydrolase